MADRAGDSSPPQVPSVRLQEILNISDRFEELSDASNSEYEDMGVATPQEEANIAYINRMTIPIVEDLVTETSKVQETTLSDILPFLEGNPNDFPLNSFGLPQLQREKHVEYLKDVLTEYPPNFVTMDAGRPWLVYWGLQGQTALGENLDHYRGRVIETWRSAQHPDGGFGGGHGQMAHLAPTYGVVLSLAMVGGTEAYESINRRTMWHYLGRMKQPDGGFTLADGGEEDVRGAYCALVVMSLLNLPLELPPDAPARAHGLTNFLDNMGEYVSNCQSYEGGVSANPGNEPHGAYTYCALSALAIMGRPRETFQKYLNIPLLVQWLSSRQCSPEGGYNGRTNKLVDGCYSHWTGTCFSFIEDAAGKGLQNRPALARYILAAAQAKRGGLVDKPGKRPDGYHTCYNLIGLSQLQHNFVYDGQANSDVGKGELGSPYHWKSEGLFEEDKVWDESDVVEEVHPVFLIPFQAAKDCRAYFEAKEGF